MTYITITLEWPIPYKLENRKNSMPKENRPKTYQKKIKHGDPSSKHRDLLLKKVMVKTLV